MGGVIIIAFFNLFLLATLCCFLGREGYRLAKKDDRAITPRIWKRSQKMFYLFLQLSPIKKISIVLLLLFLLWTSIFVI